ncbi:hypothetical protein LIER_32633 [Lithospermum erythrorhizon]|uniref:Uncharacterized protein n=1 Tax=Lithospermum erythrorhizon TaxID=34254 RepID=A0AAV3RXT4_LITER
MVKTRGGTSETSNKDRCGQESKFSRPIGVNKKGKPVPLQSIPPSPDQQKEVPTKKPEDGRKVGSQLVRVEKTVEDVNPEKGSKFAENVQPSVKDTSVETSFKSAKSQSSVNPTMAKILDGLKKNAKGGRIKRALRKQAAPVRYKARDVNPSVGENAGKSTRKDQGSDDDVVVVSSTASKRRTRASTIALEKKRGTLNVGREVEAEEVMDLEELENLLQKKKAAKRTNIDDLKEGAVSKKRKGVFIFERSHVMHKMAIANLVLTSNNTNVSEVVGRMMYVMGSGQDILIHQHPEILKAGDGSVEDAKPLTITNKLISRKRVVDVEIKGSNKPTIILEGKTTALLIKAYEEEQHARS